MTMGSKALKQKSILINGISSEILNVLLKDNTTGSNIIWATNDYISIGNEYSFNNPIYDNQITGANDNIIKPRVEKDRESQTQRSKDKAEVFTPSWVCNAQNNLIDNAWFGLPRNRFNTERNNSWETNYYKITFPQNKCWQDYVTTKRLEISCGEAPYLTSRYDTVTGKMIPVKKRIGILDRKLRIISENVDSTENWKKWAKYALQSTYGYEWQGDNVLLARENVLLTTIEHFNDKFNEQLDQDTILLFANIISWNIWQMDGIKYVIPNTCHEVDNIQISLFETEEAKDICPGCKTGDYLKHNGIYATIMDWDENNVVRFVDLLEGVEQDGTI